MHFKKLYIKNLASIEEAEIDFENGPLSEDALFLICGETGSGKTTLLDAICLALFNNTPRMEQSKQECYYDHPTNSETAQNQISKTDDPRQLLRRNTGEAIVQLEFTGSNDLKYTAIWNVYRSHRKSTGTLQDIRWTLIDETNNCTYTKKGEIKEEISQAVGLTFEQFCRTTMLAQGDFTRFLKSDSKDKSDILEKLTGTAIYSRIGIQIFQINKQKRNALEQQQLKLNNIRLFTPEELEQYNTELQEYIQQIGRMRQKQKELQALEQWQKRAIELARQAEIKHNELTKKQTELQSEQFLAKEKLLEQWHSSADARTQLNQLTVLRQREKELQKQLLEKSNTYANLCFDLKQLKLYITKIEQNVQQVRNIQTALAPLSSMLENEQAISATLRQLIQQRVRLDSLKERELQLRQQLTIQEEKSKASGKEAQKLAEQLEQLQKNITEQQQQLNQKKATEVLQQKSLLEQERHLLQPALTDITLLIERRNNKQQARTSCSNWQNQLQKTAEAEKAATLEQTEKKKAADDFEQLFNKQKAAIEDWAREARFRLHPGDSCPVCGQTVHNIPTDEQFRSILTPMQEMLDLLKKECDEQEAKVRSLNAQRKAYEEQYRQAVEILHTCEANYSEAYTKASQSCAACGIPTFQQDTPAQLDNRLKNVQTQLEHLNIKEQEINRLNQHIQQLQQKKDQLQTLFNTKNKETNQLEQLHAALKKQIEELIRQASSEQQALSEQENLLAPQILWEDWKNIWKNDPSQLLTRLEQTGKTYRLSREQQQQLEQQLNQAQSELREAERSCQSVTLDFPEWTQIPATRTLFQPEGLLSRWNELQSQAYNLAQSRNNLRKETDAQTQALQDFYHTHPDISPERLSYLTRMTTDDTTNLQHHLQKARNEEVALQSALKLILEEQEQHIGNSPPFALTDDQSLEEQLRSTEQAISETDQKIGRLTTTLEENRQRQKQCEQEQNEYKRLESDYHKWNSLCHLFGDNNGVKFRNIAQSYVLRELLYHANQYLRQFTDRYEMICPSVSLTILIRDFYQGGAQRPTSTLSGGESFLVSLSLALGLSALTHDNQSVDTLFIDEGFGTLSSDYLNVVMDTLEKLHQLNGKRVGIISHVEGLRERIRTQIQVRRKDNSCSEIKTVCLN